MTKRSADIVQWQQSIADNGFAQANAEDMHSALLRFGSLQDWTAFATSWNDLEVDTYLLNHGRYRRRRHAVFTVDNAQSVENQIRLQPHQPHYQSEKYNSLQGGIERWFQPISPALTSSQQSLTTIVRFCNALFSSLAPAVTDWQVEVHQFRIEALPDLPGQPTPEGVHRDGVDYVLVLLIDRRNIASGTTTIHTPDQQLLGSFTLTKTFDAALVDDARVMHGVTAVQPIHPNQPAYRDVLVITFRRRTTGQTQRHEILL